MDFRGTYDYSLDAKNRLTVPAKFRATLAEGVVLAKAEEPCVSLWTPSAYKAYVDATLSNFRSGSPDARKLQRFFSANAHDSELDAAGRVMVPPFLMEHAGLGKEVKVIGAGDALEIWDRQGWTTYDATLSDDVSDITARLDHTA